MNDKTHLYMVSHTEIPSHHQAIQATHAALKAAKTIDVERINLVHLICNSKTELLDISNHLKSNQIEVHHFEEPYNDWGLTAISCALSPNQRHLLSHLSLWEL